MTRKNPFLAAILSTAVFVLLAAGLLVSARSTKQPADPPQDFARNKIAQWVIEHTAGGEGAEFIVVLKEQAELFRAAGLHGKRDKGRYVRDALYAKARTSQSSLLEWLRANGVEHQSFYIVNAILVKGNRAVAETIAARADVERIDGNPAIRGIEPPQLTPEEMVDAARQTLSPQAIEPGVNYIRAPEVWASGFTGQGVVIGGADSGIKWDHPALINKYRGWNGSTANHNYNWHDSIHSGGGACGHDSPAPCDDDNHGTHTMGTVVGSDAGNVNRIGVAPGTKFISCRNMDRGVGTPARYIECMEWFLAPYPVGGTPAQGDPAKAPDLTTNSWGCPRGEGCQPATLQRAVEAQRAAGIMFVASAGNGGASCSSVSDPPALYDATYTVGAISSSTGEIASFSSRGPVTADGSNRIKPDITAPGLSVRSAVRNGGYAGGFTWSGTSMASPHVAGAIALLWSARPSLRHQIDQTEALLNQAAVDVVVNSCNSSGVPNNRYGWGRLDIKAAVDLASGRTVSVVSAASFAATALATESIAAAFGVGLATRIGAAASLPLPTSLAGTMVDVKDSAGKERQALLFFVAPSQVNFLIPAGTATGAATITITSGDGASAIGITQIAAVAPGLFTANANGQGVATAALLRVKADGSQIYEPVSRYDDVQKKFVAAPIDLGPESDQVFLILFGTGLRNRSGLAAVSVLAGGLPSQVLYAGSQGALAGVDQINLRLPRALAGRGLVDLLVTADGRAANTVQVSVR